MSSTFTWLAAPRPGGVTAKNHTCQWTTAPLRRVEIAKVGGISLAEILQVAYRPYSSHVFTLLSLADGERRTQWVTDGPPMWHFMREVGSCHHFSDWESSASHTLPDQALPRTSEAGS